MRDASEGAVAVPPASQEKPKRRLLRRPARREQILVAATRAFAESGFAATSLDDVATAAEISRDVIYRHFRIEGGALPGGATESPGSPGCGDGGA